MTSNHVQSRMKPKVQIRLPLAETGTRLLLRTDPTPENRFVVGWWIISILTEDPWRIPRPFRMLARAPAERPSTWNLHPRTPGWAAKFADGEGLTKSVFGPSGLASLKSGRFLQSQFAEDPSPYQRSFFWPGAKRSLPSATTLSGRCRSYGSLIAAARDPGLETSWRKHSRGRTACKAGWRLGPGGVPEAVASRQDVVRAFGISILLKLGPAVKAVTYRIGGRIRRATGDTAEPRNRLASVYEKARYTPPMSSLGRCTGRPAKRALFPGRHGSSQSARSPSCAHATTNFGS